MTAIPLQMAKISRLVIKAMVYLCTGIDMYELYVGTHVLKQILILLFTLTYVTDLFSEY